MKMQEEEEAAAGGGVVVWCGVVVEFIQNRTPARRDS